MPVVVKKWELKPLLFILQQMPISLHVQLADEATVLDLLKVVRVIFKYGKYFISKGILSGVMQFILIWLFI